MTFLLEQIPLPYHHHQLNASVQVDFTSEPNSRGDLIAGIGGPLTAGLSAALAGVYALFLAATNSDLRAEAFATNMPMEINDTAKVAKINLCLRPSIVGSKHGSRDRARLRPDCGLIVLHTGIARDSC
jgi:hypothetical protein